MAELLSEPATAIRELAEQVASKLDGTPVIYYTPDGSLALVDSNAGELVRIYTTNDGRSHAPRIRTEER